MCIITCAIKQGYLTPSGKKGAVNKRTSKFQARRIFYHNSAGRKVQYENFRLHLVPLLISNLLPAYDPTNLLSSRPSSPAPVLSSRFNINYARISSVESSSGKKHWSPPTRENPLSTEHAPTFLAKFKLNDPTLWPRA